MEKMYNILYCGFLLILVFCSQQDEKNSYTGVRCENINVHEAFNNGRRKLLSSITSDIKYVKLETNESCIINKIEKILFFDSLIFISNEKQFFIFSIDGNFIRSIEGYGRGPGEFLEIEDFDLLVSKKLIAIFDDEQGKLIFYDLSGNFKNEFPINIYPRRINFIDSLIVVASVFPEYFYNNNYTLSIYTTKGEIKYKLLYRNSEIEDVNTRNVDQIPSTDCVRLEVYNDTLTYWETHSNKVFKIINREKLIEKYYLDYPNDNFQQSMIDYKNMDFNSVRFGDFIEVKNYLFLLRGIYKNDVMHIVYNKKNKEIYKLEFECDDLNFKMNTGYYNDIDGGYPFLPEGVVANNKVYCVFYPYQLKSLLKEEPLKSQEYKNEQKRMELQNLLEDSDVLDNPVIMIITI